MSNNIMSGYSTDQKLINNNHGNSSDQKLFNMTEENDQQQGAVTPEETPQGENQAPRGDVDYKAEAAKFKAIAERKTKQLEKVLESVKDEEEVEINKTNTPPVSQTITTGLSRDEAVLISRGYEIEEVDLAKKIAQVNEISIAEATKDGYFQSVVKVRKEKDLSDKAQVTAASGPLSSPEKPLGEMTREEHVKFVTGEMKKIA